MPSFFKLCPLIALLGLLLASPALSVATECVLPGEPLQSCPVNASPHLRLAEGSNRACMDGCIAQCRAAQQGCSGDSCRAQFQICARRCVVSCGPR